MPSNATRVDDSRLSFVTVTEASSPPEGRIFHIKDKWWVAVDGKLHPNLPREIVLVRYQNLGQCHTDRNVIDKLCTDLYPWAKAHYMPSAFFKLALDP